MAKKSIQPIRWSRSDHSDAVILDTMWGGGSVGDSINVEWRLMTDNSAEVVDMGVILIEGDDYQTWVSNDNKDQFVFDFILTKFPLAGNIVIIGDYIPS